MVQNVIHANNEKVVN